MKTKPRLSVQYFIAVYQCCKATGADEEDEEEEEEEKEEEEEEEEVMASQNRLHEL